MTDLATLLADREKLSARLATIEAAWADIVASVASADAEIAEAKKARAELVKSGQRIYALLQECKSELCRYDALIKSTVDSIADYHIGERQGAYLLKHGMIIARTRVNGSLYTAMVQIYDSG